MSELRLADVDALLSDLEAEFEGSILVAGGGEGSTNSCVLCTGGCESDVS